MERHEFEANLGRLPSEFCQGWNMKACLRPNQTSEQTGLTKYTNEDDGDYHLEAGSFAARRLLQFRRGCCWHLVVGGQGRWMSFHSQRIIWPQIKYAKTGKPRLRNILEVREPASIPVVWPLTPTDSTPTSLLCLSSCFFVQLGTCRTQCGAIWLMLTTNSLAQSESTFKNLEVALALAAHTLKNLSLQREKASFMFGVF